MNRSIIAILISFVAILATMHTSYADDPKPTPEQLEAAKKAFGEGKSLHDQGKLPEAIEKFKESYRLSKNPLLLYNIGFTLDEANQKDKALFYYRKFLSDAPQEAPQRATVSARVAVIEKENLDADLNGTPTKPDLTTVTTTKPDATKPDTAKPLKIKPSGTYSATDFQHQVVEEAPPGKPLDISAFVPEDSGFTVTLYFRGANDSKFASKLMKWRYKELVGRIPSAKVSGSSIQYYLEVKDSAGTLVTRSGKSTSPNLVNLEPGATPRFYPDITEEGTPTTPQETKHHDEEDPLNKNSNQVIDEPVKPLVREGPTEPEVPGQGLTDVGSNGFRKMKWGSTITAAGMFGLSIGFGILAAKQASALADDAANCPGGSKPPCRMFDQYDKDLESAGKRYQTLETLTIVVGVAATGVAIYYWYKEHKANSRGELKVTTKNNSPETTWVVTPTVSDGFTGAAAAARF